jgi:hypothetical protein
MAMTWNGGFQRFENIPPPPIEDRENYQTGFDDFNNGR